MKHIAIEERSSENRKPAFDIRGKDSSLLGKILYYPEWRKYVFEPGVATIWDETCLSSIMEFLNICNGKES